MLFTCKRHLRLTLFLAGIFAAVSWTARDLLGISWSWSFTSRHLIDLAVCLTVVVIQDFAIHAAPWFLVPRLYRPSYRALVEHFRGQRIVHFLASGVLAAAEELLFRGIVLEGIRQRAELGVGLALAISAALFGLAHVPRPRPLRIFGVFALWEGLVLGAVYIYSGSLLFSMVLHGLHDIAGYSFFALERHRGVWLPGPNTSRVPPP